MLCQVVESRDVEFVSDVNGTWVGTLGYVRYMLQPLHRPFCLRVFRVASIVRSRSAQSLLVPVDLNVGSSIVEMATNTNTRRIDGSFPRRHRVVERGAISGWLERVATVGDIEPHGLDVVEVRRVLRHVLVRHGQVNLSVVGVHVHELKHDPPSVVWLDVVPIS